MNNTQSRKIIMRTIKANTVVRQIESNCDVIVEFIKDQDNIILDIGDVIAASDFVENGGSKYRIIDERITHKPKTAFDEYSEFLIELVPGVFIDNKDPNNTAVYIVDRKGESATWNSTEVAEDPMAFIAAISAVALAAKYNSHAVRENIENKGKNLDAMVMYTKRHVDSMLPLTDNKYGYTEPLVNEILQDHNIARADFWKWMDGQTMAVNDGGRVVYPEDLLNFLNNGQLKAPITD